MLPNYTYLLVANLLTNVDEYKFIIFLKSLICYDKGNGITAHMSNIRKKFEDFERKRGRNDFSIRWMGKYSEIFFILWKYQKWRRTVMIIIFNFCWFLLGVTFVKGSIWRFFFHFKGYWWKISVWNHIDTRGHTSYQRIVGGKCVDTVKELQEKLCNVIFVGHPIGEAHQWAA